MDKGLDIPSKSTYKWPTGYMKRCSISRISGKCKSKLQWDITSQLLDGFINFKNFVKNIENLEPLETADKWIQNGAATMNTSMEVLPQILATTPIWTSNSTSGYIYKTHKTKPGSRGGICTPMFTAAFSRKAKIWEQPKCPTMDEWRKKMHIHTVEHIQTAHIRKSCCCC